MRKDSLRRDPTRQNTTLIKPPRMYVIWMEKGSPYCRDVQRKRRQKAKYYKSYSCNVVTGIGSEDRLRDYWSSNADLWLRKWPSLTTRYVFWTLINNAQNKWKKSATVINTRCPCKIMTRHSFCYPKNNCALLWISFFLLFATLKLYNISLQVYAKKMGRKAQRNHDAYVSWAFHTK